MPRVTNWLINKPYGVSYLVIFATLILVFGPVYGLGMWLS
jgi:hypothetical protein